MSLASAAGLASTIASSPAMAGHHKHNSSKSNKKLSSEQVKVIASASECLKNGDACISHCVELL